MPIEITGRCRKLCKVEAQFAAAFFARYLLGPRLSKTVHIDLEFANMTGIADGFCSPYEVGRNPRMFEVSVNSNTPRYKQLQIIAHEMVHVKQYAKNELRSDDSSSASFAGKAYKITSSLEDYLNYPWEIEAFGREKGLYLIYALTLKQNKIKFKNGKMYVRGKYVKVDKLKIAL